MTWTTPAPRDPEELRPAAEDGPHGGLLMTRMTWRSLIAMAAVALLATGCASPPSMLGEGTYEVPDEIRPGTYTTWVIQDGGMDNRCSWWRYGLLHDGLKLKGAASYDVGQQGRVTVRDSDESVMFAGDCKWTLEEG